MDIDHGTPDDNAVIRLVVEDTIDADGNGLRRTIWGIDDEARRVPLLACPAVPFGCRSSRGSNKPSGKPCTVGGHGSGMMSEGHTPRSTAGQARWGRKRPP